jgi:hypothetical protein
MRRLSSYRCSLDCQRDSSSLGSTRSCTNAIRRPCISRHMYTILPALKEGLSDCTSTPSLLCQTLSSVSLQAAEAAGSAQAAGHMAHGAGQEAAGSSKGSCCCTAGCLEGPPAAHKVKHAYSCTGQQMGFAHDWICRLVLHNHFA